MKDDHHDRDQYDHERRPKSQLPVGVTRLPVKDVDYPAAMALYLTSRGLDYQLASENGWYHSLAAGDHYSRIVIPCVNTKGYVYWQARATDPTVQRRYQSPSYSSSDSLAIVWPRSGSSGAAIVEGPMDALAAAEVGVVGVATMGKQPSVETLAHIVSLFQHYDITVVPDKADIEAGSRVAMMLASQYGKFVRVVVPLAKDLAAMPVAQREAIFGY